MNERKSEFDFSGANFTGAQNFATGGTARVDQVFVGDSGGGELEELRRLVTELVGLLEQHSRTDVDSARAHDQATELEELLRQHTPDSDGVRKRWSRLRPLLDTLGHTGSVASIAGLISSLF